MLFHTLHSEQTTGPDDCLKILLLMHGKKNGLNTNSAVSWEWIANITDNITASVVIRLHTGRVHNAL